MLFTSYAFLAFLAALVLLYYLLPRRCQAPLLLAASVLFYFFAGWQSLFFIAFTTVSVWAAGRLTARSFSSQKAYLSENGSLSAEEKKAYKDAKKRGRKAIVTVVLLLNLAVLAAAKYLHFLLGGANFLLSFTGFSIVSPSDWILPMGISFYTLQSIGYLVDVYRGAVPAEKRLWRFALFVSFFPQLVQGPISRFGDLSETLFAPHPFSPKTLGRGLERVIWGYFKKLVVADRLAAAIGVLTGGVEKGGWAWAASLLVLYTVQLYADFTGGIDITIGIAEMLGIRVQENFRRPFLAVSLKDYWRRWHISMCSWFRDYVFYPVSTSRWMRAFTRFTRRRFGERAGKRIPLYLSSFLVWGATGLWHGANWNFVTWGLANWAVLMISEELEPLYEKFHKRAPFSNGAPWRVFSIARTFVLVAAMNLFDCFPTLSGTFQAFLSLFRPADWSAFAGNTVFGLGAADYAAAGAGAALMIAVSLLGAKKSVRDRLGAIPYPVHAALIFVLLAAVIVFGAYGKGYDAAQFIYNNF